MFKLSAFQDPLQKWLRDNPRAICFGRVIHCSLSDVVYRVLQTSSLFTPLQKRFGL